MKKLTHSAILFLLATSVIAPAQQSNSAPTSEAAGANASLTEKSGASKHDDRSDHDRKNKKKDKSQDKVKKTPSKEEKEYDPVSPNWG